MSINPPLHSLLPQILTVLCILSYLLDEAREFAVSFRSSDFTFSWASCNKPNHTLATLGQFCCSKIVWMEKIPSSIVNLVTEDVPSIVLNGLDNKHQSFWEDTTYEDETDNWNFRYILKWQYLVYFEPPSFFFFLSLGTCDVEFFFFPGNFRYILHAIAIEDFSQLENCKYMLIFIIIFAGKLQSWDFFLLPYHFTGNTHRFIWRLDNILNYP